MTPGAEDAAVRASVLAILVANYRADGPSLPFTDLAEKAEAPLGLVGAVCGELIDAGHAYGKGEPPHAVRLNDNGFAFANDTLSLGLLERHELDGTT